MAERNQLKIAPQSELSDDDPFAELTRIMGFDPRQPAKPAEPRNLSPANQPADAAPAEEVAAEDDFGIDLEKELMGEFAEFEEDAAQPAAQPEPVAEAQEMRAVEEAEIDLDLELDEGFDVAATTEVATEAEDDRWAVSEPESVEERQAKVEAALGMAAEDLPPAEAEAEEDLAADFDAAMADVDMDFEPGALAVEAVAADAGLEERAADVDEELIALDLDEDDLVLATESTAEPVAEAAPMGETLAEDELELELGPEAFAEIAKVVAADEGAAEDELEVELELGPEAFAEIAEDVAADEVAAAEDEIEVELDLEPEAFEEIATAAPVAAAAETELTDDDAVDLDDRDLQDAELRLDDLAEDIEPDAPALTAEPAPAPLAAEAPKTAPRDMWFRPQEEKPAAKEFSFEDELNALLGNLGPAKIAPTPQREERNVASMVPSRQERSVAPAAQPTRHDDWRHAPIAPSTEAAAADDLNWEIDELELSTEAEPVAEDAFDAGDYGAPEAGPVHAAADDDLPDFDDDAFEAALTAGIEKGSSHASTGRAQAHHGKEDPLDVINALAAKYSQQQAGYGRATAAAPAARAQAAPAHAKQDEIDFPASMFDEPPHVETVDVADRAVALADDLDIPELDFEQDVPSAAAYDDLDTEFASLLNDMNVAQPAPPRAAPQPAAYADDSVGDDYFGDIGYPAAASTRQQAHAQRPAYDDDPGQFEFDADDLPGSQPVAAEYADEDYEYEPAEGDAAVPMQAERPPQRRGLLVAGIVGAVAIVGGVGAFALSFGDSGSDVPAIVMADESPVKVKPANPGGTTVPNQDSKVYETVAGGAATAESQPQQEKLVTTAEEPVDVAPPLPEPRALELAPPAADEEVAAAQPKGEDRIEQILQDAEQADPDAEVIAVAPRKVRTMIVKPDGTLVPREDPLPAATEAVAPAPAPAVPEATASVPAAESAPALEQPAAEAPAAAAADVPAAMEAMATAEVPAAAEAPVAPEAAASAEAPAAEAPAIEEIASVGNPEVAPIAPPRPVEQPVDVVGEVKADKVKPDRVTTEKVAVAAPSVTAAAPVAAGGATWSMQIASQPSEAAARSSYQDLAGRFGGVLAGREVNIVKAEIAGKGTFWRVRVPAKSRNDAISLCESYKSAGGNCFVSR